MSSTETVVSFFERQLDHQAIQLEKNRYVIKTKYSHILFEFIFDIDASGNGVQSYSLMIPMYKEGRLDFHIEEEGRACLGLDSELSNNPDDIVICIIDFLESTLNRLDNGDHNHGYRHGWDGALEMVLQRKFLPFERNSVHKLTQDELNLIAKNSLRLPDDSTENITIALLTLIVFGRK